MASPRNDQSFLDGANGELGSAGSASLPFQRQHAFQMPGLRKKIEWLRGCQGIAGREEFTEIADLRRGIARHVDDGTGTETEELREKGGIAAFARRIDD